MKAIILASLLVGSVSFANRESGGRGGATAVYVNFISVGSGVDAKAKAQYENLVAEAKSQGLVQDQTVQIQGREGEVLACVKLSSGSARIGFIQALAPQIIADTKDLGIQRTSVYLGADCHHFNNASEQDLTKYAGNN